jgi:hypothetical protein
MEVHLFGCKAILEVDAEKTRATDTRAMMGLLTF